MRIQSQPIVDTTILSKATPSANTTVENVEKQGISPTISSNEPIQQVDNSDSTKEKVQQAVAAMNDVLDVNQSSSKFMYHEGLDRYYVTVVDKDTDEVVKEIPPKKLLDAFYEMQKMVGMIVDEKI